MRDQSESGGLLHPGAILAARDGASHHGVDVTVGEHDHAGAESGNDFVLQTVGEVGQVIHRHGDGTEGVALLGFLDPLAGQRGTGHAGIENGVTQFFEPRLQAADLGAAADRIRSFDDDQLALELGVIDAGSAVR